MSRKTLAQLLLLAVVAIWGVTFALVKGALADASPLLFNLLRMTIAAVALWIVNRRQLRGIPRHHYLAGIIAGFLLAAGYQFQTLGLARTTAAKSALITGLVVVFVPILTMIPALRPRDASPPRWTAAAGSVFAFSGLVLLTTPAGTQIQNVTTSISGGDLLTLLCALAFAGHLLSLAHLAPRVPAGQLATLQVGFASLFMLMTLPLSRPLYLHLSVRLAVALAVTSLLATAAAFTVQTWAQQHLPPNNTAILLTLEPVFAVAISIVFLGDRLTPRSLAGAVLILAGIAAIELFALPVPVVIDPA